jgi:predicted neuraminidase
LSHIDRDLSQKADAFTWNIKIANGSIKQAAGTTLQGADTMACFRLIPLTLIAALSLSGATLCADEIDKLAAVPPTANYEPGPEYADSVRMFQGIPSLERSPGGRLWATWYGGGITEDKYNYIMVVTSGDDGKTWSDLKFVLDPDRDGPVRAFDPCPWLDPNGKLWLIWAQRSKTTPYLMAMTTENPDDEDATWSEPFLIHDGIMMCKPTAIDDGTWLLPTAIWFQEGSCRVLASTDQGKTWSLRGTATVQDPKDRNCDEPMIVQRKDGSLWQWVRTKYGIGTCESTDNGRTWSDVVPSDVPHTVARFFIRRLASGNLLLVKHGPMDKRTGRSHLTAFVSKDDGKTWQGGLLLDQRTGVSYPDGFQGDDGRIYIIYDFHRRDEKTILLAVFTEDDVLEGKDVSGKVRQRVLINQATGVNPGSAPKPVKLDSHSDGAKPLQGEGTELKPTKDGESCLAFANGAKLFTDRGYVAENLPSLFKGRKFVQTSIDGENVEVARDGIVFAITPLPNRNKDSVAKQLVEQGFAKVAQPEFRLFGSNANICTTFQKKVAAGDKITLGKWGVLIY